MSLSSILSVDQIGSGDAHNQSRPSSKSGFEPDKFGNGWGDSDDALGQFDASPVAAFNKDGPENK
jgi:hypothetical protein